MEYLTLVLNYDDCYCDNKIPLMNKYLGPIVCLSKEFYFWKNNMYNRYYSNVYQKEYMKYQEDMHIQKIHHVVYNNYREIIPPNTEILIVGPGILGYCKKIPDEVKIICYTGYWDIKIITINLPVGLKYLCLTQHNKPETINKIKIPFGCKLILF
jgi:hypothetical protein